jgi:hypothetical protein
MNVRARPLAAVGSVKLNGRDAVRYRPFSHGPSIGAFGQFLTFAVHSEICRRQVFKSA